MSGVPNVFGSATSSIPLSQLDVNFNTPVTIGNTTVGLGNTVTSFGNVTLTNTTISGLSGGSANGVVYINSSNVAVSNSSVLDFDGANLGLGVTPSAWSSGIKAAQIGLGASVFGSTSSYNNTNVTANIFYNSGGTAIYQGSDFASFYQQVSGSHRWFNAPSGTAGNAITFTQEMTLDASGNLLVGLTSTSTAPGGTVIFSGANSGIAIGHATGSGAIYNYFQYNGTTIGSVSQNGTTAVLYNVTSDQRLKENIQDADSASSLIDSLQVRKFDWKTDRTHQRYGFVAQELVTVAPEAVYQPSDTDEMMAVDYSKLVPMLVKEVQSLRKRLADAGI